MAAPNPSMKELARQLLVSSQNPSDLPVNNVAIAIGKLRISLTRFAGNDGFVSLLRRALVLARAEVLSLQSVKVGPDGHILGFEQIAIESPNEGIEEAIAITAQLLTLLGCFIGEPLTRSILREAWPDIPLEDLHL